MCLGRSANAASCYRFPPGVPPGRRIRIPPGHGDGRYGIYATWPLRLWKSLQLALGHLQRRLRAFLGQNRILVQSSAHGSTMIQFVGHHKGYVEDLSKASSTTCG